MNEKKERNGKRAEPLRGTQWWRDRCAASRKRLSDATELAPVELTAGEMDAVASLRGGGASCGLVEEMARGPLAEIATENGEVTERGLGRVRGAVKFLAAMLGGMKHAEAMSASGLMWAQVNAFITICPEFERMYMMARGGMKRAMGAAVLDTAYELATEGEERHDKDGNPLGYRKKSEKMLDRLLVLSGKEFRKDGESGKGSGGAAGAGLTLNFHFDGKGRPGAAGAVDV